MLKHKPSSPLDLHFGKHNAELDVLNGPEQLRVVFLAILLAVDMSVEALQLRECCAWRTQCHKLWLLVVVNRHGSSSIRCLGEVVPCAQVKSRSGDKPMLFAYSANALR
jgi:hypothetical protein